MNGLQDGSTVYNMAPFQSFIYAGHLLLRFQRTAQEYAGTRRYEMAGALGTEVEKFAAFMTS
jgi:hypothetical protein